MRGTMQTEKTMGIVTKVHKCRWLKINTKVIRKNALDGAMFPHIITVRYAVAGKVYNKRKFIKPFEICPKYDENIGVWYDKSNPQKISLSY